MEYKYCVYEHWLDGECIYVGSGSIKNKRFKTSITRNRVYEDIVKNRREEIEVKIIEKFTEKQDSINYEENLTREYRKNGFAKGNLKNGNKDQVISKEHRESISKYMKENNPSTINGAPNKGVPMKESQKANIRNTIIKKNELYYKMVLCLEDSITFRNAYDASLNYNIDFRNIVKNCNNNKNTNKIKPTRKYKKTFMFTERSNK